MVYLKRTVVAQVVNECCCHHCKLVCCFAIIRYHTDPGLLAPMLQPRMPFSFLPFHSWCQAESHPTEFMWPTKEGEKRQRPEASGHLLEPLILYPSSNCSLLLWASWLQTPTSLDRLQCLKLVAKHQYSAPNGATCWSKNGTNSSAVQISAIKSSVLSVTSCVVISM